MKKLLVLIIFAAILSGCVSTGGNGDLTGVTGRAPFDDIPTLGMVFIPAGSYNMGPNDQDVPWAMTAETKTVSVPAFWMDETEITNNQYRQFVYWVRDSLAYLLLGQNSTTPEDYQKTQNDYGEDLTNPIINWETEIDYNSDENRPILEELYLKENERYYRRKELDTRKLNYKYYWIDLKQAARKFNFNGEARRSYDFETNKYDGKITNFSKGANKGQQVQIKDRSSYIMEDVVNVYPDTLCWVGDFTYSYNEPMTNMYFWHPTYDNYPVVGVSWRQARAFCFWRTQLYNSYQQVAQEQTVQDYRLPTESEWEYAARGGLKEAMYPWGGFYATNYKGCYIANFKPMRGNYPADGGFYPVIVANNEPNDYGLYDMAGNVAEWTSNAFDESAYSFTDDLSPDYTYDALPNEPPTMKRKVIRGGSWKDIAYYMQCGVRTYEYQDTAKSYIGFRCVRAFLGHDFNDESDGSNLY
jgi:formylglycine-generating enzyme